MFTYKVTLHHDNGTGTLTVRTTSYAKAIARVMLVEGCPERSITKIEREWS